MNMFSSRKIKSRGIGGYLTFSAYALLHKKYADLQFSMGNFICMCICISSNFTNRYILMLTKCIKIQAHLTSISVYKDL